MDGSQRRKVIYALRGHGFVPLRDTTHGTLWGRLGKRETQFVLVGRRTSGEDPRGVKNLRAVMRRYGVTI